MRNVNLPDGARQRRAFSPAAPRPRATYRRRTCPARSIPSAVGVFTLSVAPGSVEGCFHGRFEHDAADQGHGPGTTRLCLRTDGGVRDELKRIRARRPTSTTFRSASSR